ncbi:MAG: acyltransferase [Microthrixaceae bacterium]
MIAAGVVAPSAFARGTRDAVGETAVGETAVGETAVGETAVGEAADTSGHPSASAGWRPPAWAARVATGAALASYGVYLWHQWVTHEWFTERNLADFQAPFPSVLAVVVVGSTVLAAITYWFVERPATTLAPGVGGGSVVEPPRRLGPQRSLDGLRGLAIVAVLGTHVVFLDAGSDTWSLRGGFLGVDIFLGLSAFLIAAVLLRELDSTAERDGQPSFNARSFARRRLRRLYPPLLVFLAIAGVVSVLVLPTTVGQQLIQTLLAVTFIANWQLSWGSHPPFDMAHLWSLSLEAQFYLLMAIGLWLGRNRLRRADRIVAGLTVAAVAVCLWRLWLYHRGVELPALYERTGARADSMLLGVAAAFIWRSSLVSEGVLRLVGIASGVFLVVAMVFSADDSAWLFEGGFTLVAAASASLVLAAVTGSGVVAAVGRWGPLRWVGEISCSLYLVAPAHLHLDRQAAPRARPRAQGGDSGARIGAGGVDQLPTGRDPGARRLEAQGLDRSGTDHSRTTGRQDVGLRHVGADPGILEAPIRWRDLSSSKVSVFGAEARPRSWPDPLRRQP